MLPADTSRCAGQSKAEVCEKRADCERYAEWLRADGPVWNAPMVCGHEREHWIPRSCAGRNTRVSNRPHPECRGDSTRQACRRFQPGADGITPYLIDQDGTASCADRVIHPIKVGDDRAVCAPNR